MTERRYRDAKLKAILALLLAYGVANLAVQVVSDLRRLHAQARDFLGHHLGEGPTNDPGSRGLHESVFSTVGGWAGLPGAFSAVAPGALAASLENELVAGLAEASGGRPFMSSRGFDWRDMEANNKGLLKGYALQASGYRTPERWNAAVESLPTFTPTALRQALAMEQGPATAQR